MRRLALLSLAVLLVGACEDSDSDAGVPATTEAAATTGGGEPVPAAGSALTAIGNELVVVGADGAGLVVWRSRDGLTGVVSRVALDVSPSWHITDVGALADGRLVAVASSDDGPVIAIAGASVTDWRVMPPDTYAGAIPTGLVNGSDRLVLTAVQPSGGEQLLPIVLEERSEGDLVASVVDAVLSEGTLTAGVVGTEPRSVTVVGASAGSVLVWSSSDLTQWRREVASNDGAIPVAAVRSPDGSLSVFATSAGSLEDTIVLSVDGSDASWSSEIISGFSVLSAVALDSSRYLLGITTTGSIAIYVSREHADFAPVE